MLNTIDKSTPSFIGLNSFLNEYSMNIMSVINILEFNLLLNSNLSTPNFDINTFVDESYNILNNLKSKKVPFNYSNTLLSVFELRKIIVDLQGFSLVSKDWVKELSNWIGNRKVLEVMSGLGVLSSVLKEEGVDIISTDNYTANNFNFSNLWTDIIQLDALQAIEMYGKDVDVIIMSWCYTDETGYKCLLKMREVNPNAVMIYIGEPIGGSTGSKSLYDNMIEISDAYIDKINKLYPTWEGVHDKLFLIK